MSRVATALKATALQQLFDLGAMLLSLVLVPVYLSRLGMEGYGLFLTGVAWASYLMFSNGGLSAATLILVSQACAVNNEAEVARIVRNARGLMVIASALVAAVSVCGFLLLRQPAAAARLNLTHPDAPALLLIVAAQVIISLLASPFVDLLFGIGQPQKVAAVQGVSRLATQLVTLGLLLGGLNVWQVFAAAPLCLAAAGLVNWWQARRAAPFAFAPGPLLEREQIILQLRTGAKSLGLQVGSTLIGTAPVFVLTATAGPSVVPLFAVPMRVLGLGNNLLTSFVAVMQANFGDAWARRDLQWLRETTRTLLKHTLVANALTIALLVSVGPALVHAWTRGRLSVSTLMVASVAVAGSSMVLIHSLKLVLSGMNRHRSAAASEITSGLLAFALAWLAVRFGSIDAVGFGVAFAAAVTSGVVIPRELRRYLETPSISPPISAVFVIVAAGVACYAVARGAHYALTHVAAPPLAGVVVAASAGALVFALTCQLVGVFDFIGAVRKLRTRAGPLRPDTGS